MMKARDWSVLLVVLLASLLVGKVACEERDQDELVGAANVALRNIEGGGQCMTDNDCHNNGECVPRSNHREEDEDDTAPGMCRCDERYAGNPNPNPIQVVHMIVLASSNAHSCSCRTP
jgi:hypothetical protein